MSDVQFRGGWRVTDPDPGSAPARAGRAARREHGWQRPTRGGTIVVAVAATVATAIGGCGSSPAAAGPAGTAAQVAGTSPATARSASASSTLPPLPAGQQGSRQDVPWAQVGPGWFLAEWSRAPDQAGTAPAKSAAPTLFLVDPSGGRYRIETLPGSLRSDYLVAWSGDGQRALLAGGSGPAMAVLDLRTAASTGFTLGGDVTPVGFTAPDGLAIIANKSAGTSHSHLERFSLTGMLERSYRALFPGPGGSYNGSALYSASGTELAAGTTTGVELMTNNGRVIRFLPVNPSVRFCSVLRWWTPEELLAGCMPASGSAIQQLWLVPTSGARPTALTARPAARGDLGDLDAWPLPAGTYVQDAGACGYTYVARLNRNERTTPVPVPGVPAGESTIILGTQGSQLAIKAKSACGGGGALMWFVPTTNSVIPLLGGSVNGGTLEAVAMFGEP